MLTNQSKIQQNKFITNNSEVGRYLFVSNILLKTSKKHQ